MSKPAYLYPVTKAISPGNADKRWARNTGLTQLIFSFQVKSHFPQKLQLETPKHKLLVVNSRGSHLPSNYSYFMFLWGRWCEGWFYAQFTLWAAWENLRDPGPNLTLTEGVHHMPEEISGSPFCGSQGTARGWGRGRQLDFGWGGIALWAQFWSLWRQGRNLPYIFSWVSSCQTSY